jgi:hypothetical protein
MRTGKSDISGRRIPAYPQASEGEGVDVDGLRLRRSTMVRTRSANGISTLSPGWMVRW